MRVNLVALDALTQDASYVAASEIALTVHQIQTASDFLLIPQQLPLVDHLDPVHQSEGPNVFLSKTDHALGCLLLAFPVGKGPHLSKSLPHFNVLEAVLKPGHESLARHVLDFLLHDFNLSLRRLLLWLFLADHWREIVSLRTHRLLDLWRPPLAVIYCAKGQPFLGFAWVHTLLFLFGVIAQVVALLGFDAFCKAGCRVARFF